MLDAAGHGLVLGIAGVDQLPGVCTLFGIVVMLYEELLVLAEPFVSPAVSVYTAFPVQSGGRLGSVDGPNSLKVTSPVGVPPAPAESAAVSCGVMLWAVSTFKAAFSTEGGLFGSAWAFPPRK